MLAKETALEKAQFMITQDPAWIPVIGRLRFDVWCEEPVFKRELFPEGQWLDPHDDHAFHFLALQGDELVAASRVCVHQSIHEIPDYFGFQGDCLCGSYPGPIANWNRLVVKAEARGQGLSRQLDQMMLSLSHHLRAKTVIGRPLPCREKPLVEMGFRVICAEPIPDEIIGNLPTKIMALFPSH